MKNGRTTQSLLLRTLQPASPKARATARPMYRLAPLIADQVVDIICTFVYIQDSIVRIDGEWEKVKQVKKSYNRQLPSNRQLLRTRLILGQKIRNHSIARHTTSCLQKL